jgi:hypothetical protein
MFSRQRGAGPSPLLWLVAILSRLLAIYAIYPSSNANPVPHPLAQEIRGVVATL